MERSLKYINIVLVALACAALGGGYWFLWRPMPQVSGELRVPVEKGASVAFDALGVPHIEAQSLEDALVAQGYITAQERLWQMETMRRQPAGELAEIVGRVALESDLEARRMRMRRVAEEIAAKMPAEEKRLFAAYARGVNAYMDSHRNRLPLEFTLLRFQPRLWRISDSVLVALAMVRNLTTTWKDEVQKRHLLAGGDREKVESLFPPRSGEEEQPGSNAWAVGGKRTASGRPILANDMHLEWSIPGTWYMAHLRAQSPQLNVSGVTLPGLPGVIVGHNARIAWGITNLHFDVQDLSIEQLDERTGQYRYQGRVEQARAEREFILIRDEKPAETIVWVTRHGPIFKAEPGEFLALRWIGGDSSDFHYPILEINQAANWETFLAALRKFYAPGSNFVYADVDGNIGYHAAGRLPKREGWRGDLPVDGASGNFEWKEYIDFDQLPQAYNPASGLIVTANQDPFPPDFPAPVNGNFSSHYRSSQIRRRLETRSSWKPDEMLSVQIDVYSAFEHQLAGALADVCARRKVTTEALATAAELLRQWNGLMEKDLAQPMIATLAWRHLRKAVGETASPGKGASYDFPMSQAVVSRMLRERPAGWFADWDTMLVRVLTDAIEEGTRMQGGDVRKWRYGVFNELTVAHPIGHRLWYVHRFFDVGPAAMSGGSTTVKQTTKRLGPSMRMVADLSNWDASLLNVPIGQSGHVLSRHYKDQWDRYYRGESFAMPFERVAPESTLTLLPLP